jgi:hypothetical protein
MSDDETLTGYERRHLQALVRMFDSQGEGLRVEVDGCYEQGLDVGSLLRAAGHLCYACAANAPADLRREYVAHADFCFEEAEIQDDAVADLRAEKAAS